MAQTIIVHHPSGGAKLAFTWALLSPRSQASTLVQSFPFAHWLRPFEPCFRYLCHLTLLSSGRVLALVSSSLSTFIVPPQLSSTCNSTIITSKSPKTMVGATRSRMRNGADKQPVSPNDDSTNADAPVEEHAGYNADSNAYTPSQESDRLPARDDVSRLSEGLEPLHLVGQDGELYARRRLIPESLTVVQTFLRTLSYP
jgi:hypothetical protein